MSRTFAVACVFAALGLAPAAAHATDWSGSGNHGFSNRMNRVRWFNRQAFRANQARRAAARRRASWSKSVGHAASAAHGARLRAGRFGRAGSATAAKVGASGARPRLRLWGRPLVALAKHGPASLSVGAITHPWSSGRRLVPAGAAWDSPWANPYGYRTPGRVIAGMLVDGSGHFARPAGW